jgi:hypothetical protein
MVGQVVMPRAALVEEDELPSLVEDERRRAQFEDSVDIRDLTLFEFHEMTDLEVSVRMMVKTVSS